MASVLANVLRNQARVALAVSRTRVTSSTAAFFNLASQRSTPSYSRSLSISQVVRDDYGYSGERIRPPTPPCTTIFVGNLPYSVEAGELTELLSTFGEIKSVRPGVFPFFSFFFIHSFIHSSFHTYVQCLCQRCPTRWHIKRLCPRRVYRAINCDQGTRGS